jgi:hypothetical protein
MILFLIDAQKLIYNNNSKITILDVKGHAKNNFVIQSAVTSLEQIHPNNLAIVTDKVE